MGAGEEEPSESIVEPWDREVRVLLARGDLVGAWAVVRHRADSGPLDGDAALGAFELGRRLLQRDDAAHAYQAFQAAYESGKFPASTPAALRLGAQARRNGDVAGARTYYEHALEHGSEPRAATAAFNLGLLAHDEDPQAAESWYRRAMQYENGGGAVAGAAAALGAIRYAAGDLDAARALFGRALESADERGATNLAHEIGELLRRRGALADAEPLLRRASEAGHPRARSALARLLVADRRFEQAEELLRQAADSQGDTAALPLLGDVLVRRVDPGADLVHLFAHGDPAALIHTYASHLPNSAELAEAEQCYRRASEAGENSALVGLGHLLMGTGRSAEAELVLRRAVRVKVPDAEALLAVLLHLRGEDEEAARILAPAVTADNLRALMVQADIDGHHEDRHAHTAGLLRRALRVGGAHLGAGGMLFAHLACLADLDGAEQTLQLMLATGDEAGLTLLFFLVTDEPELAESLRQARDTCDDAAIHRFTALAVRAMRA